MADLHPHSTVKRMSTNQRTEWIQANAIQLSFLFDKRMTPIIRASVLIRKYTFSVII